ncbi:helix-turn-helix domain-containing protein [Nocardioides speluncae]|uniref:helix-turn-helix domain-containing protein n=1 Tax=Nocardioides speluncae TaxID=2670337 RepID=UPI000D6994B2|nr:helix-turn-helix transcriptional regulator [Nocardioides speluncae]
MPRRTNALAVLGFSEAEAAFFLDVLGMSGSPVDTVAAATSRTSEELLEDLKPFLALGLVSVAGGVVTGVSPAQAVNRLIGSQAEAVRRVAERLDQFSDAIPSLLAASWAGRPEGSDPVEAEVLTGGDIPTMLTSWIRQSDGDLLWFRPDQWRLPHESAVTEAVAEAIEQGRQCRSIYPARALEEAPDALAARALAGEQVRVVAELPTRLAIFGRTAALLPETLGVTTNRRLVIRQPALVDSLRVLFELLWDQAVVVPGLTSDQGGRADDRRLLLQQLAAGARDEEIAGALGLSLRTVRRRVAAVMAELGVETRFQAGVEAVRRGWL